MNPAFFSSARMILLECRESLAVYCHQHYMLTQHYSSFLVKFGGVLDLQCCKYFSLTKWIFIQISINISSNFLTREGRVLANGCTHLSSMTIFVHFIYKKCHSKNYHSDTKYYMTLNIIFSALTQFRISTHCRCKFTVSFTIFNPSKFQCAIYRKSHTKIGVTYNSYMDTCSLYGPIKQNWSDLQSWIKIGYFSNFQNKSEFVWLTVLLTTSAAWVDPGLAISLLSQQIQGLKITTHFRST